MGQREATPSTTVTIPTGTVVLQGILGRCGKRLAIERLERSSGRT